MPMFELSKSGTPSQFIPRARLPYKSRSGFDLKVSPSYMSVISDEVGRFIIRNILHKFSIVESVKKICLSKTKINIIYLSFRTFSNDIVIKILSFCDRTVLQTQKLSNDIIKTKNCKMK
eukprot:Pompholyxophrys_sp_v1_NODE_175_length_1343_cov_1.472826.p2 type:complete len:119 gc:universal NODE_175_length_1343_cov_1.472826:1208-852(-)